MNRLSRISILPFILFAIFTILSCVKMERAPYSVGSPEGELLFLLTFHGSLPTPTETIVPPLRTYLTTCYDTPGATIPCTGTGQDGDYQYGRVANFTGPVLRSGDYVTIDNTTGLTWQTCSMGQSGIDCSTGSPTADTLSNAVSYCETTLNGSSYAGITTWRLPTLEEMESLVKIGEPDPDTNPSAFNDSFPGIASDGSGTGIFYYWALTPYAPDSATYGWGVNYDLSSGSSTSDRTTQSIIMSNSYYVRCVSGSNALPAPTFKDKGDGTVYDVATGLLWQKCSMGQTNDSACSGTSTVDIWENALTYCNNLSLAGQSWRLPNINELQTIVDYTTASAPTLDTVAFPNTPPEDSSTGAGNYNYWSSTNSVGLYTQAWSIQFDSGRVVSSDKDDVSFYARCVAGP